MVRQADTKPLKRGREQEGGTPPVTTERVRNELIPKELRRSREGKKRVR